MSIPRGTKERSLSDTTRDLLQTVEPYLVASAVGAASGAPVPGMPALHRIDPFRVENGAFLGLVHELAALTTPHSGLPLPPWALYDCGMVPGAVFGFGRGADRTPGAVRDALGVAEGDGRLVPLSLIVALPLLEAGAWHVFGLRAIDEVLPNAVAGPLRPATLVAALAALQARRATSVVGWGGGDLSFYARFAPLELVTAWTPGHTHAEVLTCRFDVQSAPAPVAPASTAVRPDDPTALRRLQAEIESGRRYEITGPPDGQGAVPLREIGQ